MKLEKTNISTIPPLESLKYLCWAIQEDLAIGTYCPSQLNMLLEKYMLLLEVAKASKALDAVELEVGNSSDFYNYTEAYRAMKKALEDLEGN